MKIEIEGDKEKVKELLEKFIDLAKKEYEKQKKEWEGKSVMGIKVMLPEFDLGFWEEGEKIIFWNTLPSPSGLKGIFFKPIAKKMKKNLEGFFKAQGVSVKIKILKE